MHKKWINGLFLTHDLYVQIALLILYNVKMKFTGVQIFIYVK